MVDARPSQAAGLTLRVPATVDELSQRQAGTPSVADIANYLAVSDGDVVVALDVARAYSLASLKGPLPHRRGEIIDMVGPE